MPSETATAGTERRYAKGLRIERRAEGDEQRRSLVGHASVFDVWTTLYEGRYFVWREIVRPTAFNRAIAQQQDVRALFNHDRNFLLGRTRSGTLKLSIDNVGLLMDADPPDVQWVRDQVIEPITRGDLDGMSFGFSVPAAEKVVTTRNADGTVVIDRGGQRITIRREGDREIEERELLDVDLVDVSAVVFPQYDGTDISLRSADAPGFAEYVRSRDVPRGADPESLRRGARVRSRLLETLAAD